VDAVGELRYRDAGFLIPCKNTGNVVAALREFGRKQKPATSESLLENNTGSVRYDMLTTKRKKRSKGREDGGRAEDRRIGFATNRPARPSGRIRHGGAQRRNMPRPGRSGPRRGSPVPVPGCRAFTAR